MNRRSFIQTLAAGAVALGKEAIASPPPNFIIILCDDLGYGDVGVYGSRIATPNIDQMAKEGVRLTNFCAASAVCSPSRAALLTGRYGVRGNVPYVLGPEQQAGLSLSETTLADSLRQAGYRTMCVGKWHLGSTPRYLPTARGFDSYFGIPYSNDNDPSILLRNTAIIETPVALESITQRYTSEAIRFLRGSKDQPFFLYLPHTFPHIPLSASPEFAGKSAAGAYGDAVQELDWSVGQILGELENLGLTNNTMVIFTSDNGPWFQGSPGRLRGRKGDTFEGGLRVPFIARWPGNLPANITIRSFASMMDLSPTILSLAKAELPPATQDGVNIWRMLNGEADAVDRPVFLYLDGYNIQCARLGRWKLHISRANGPAFAPTQASGRVNLRLVDPELYDVESDPEEAYDMAASNPSIVRDIRARVEAMLPSLPPQVLSAWHDTMNRPVDPVNAGEWPRSK